VKDIPDRLDIEEYRTNPGNSDRSRLAATVAALSFMSLIPSGWQFALRRLATCSVYIRQRAFAGFGDKAAD
jgi:hypothetical protein